MFFVPQTSYATEGTLKDQVIYPLDGSTCNDEIILGILDEVGLLYLSKRWGLHNVVPWEDVLSGVEMWLALLLRRNCIHFVISGF